MKQLNTITKLQQVFLNVKGIDVALLYGSFGRNEPTPNSDIDIQLLVNKDFDQKMLATELLRVFSAEIKVVHPVSMRDKVVIYFKNHPKVELAICTDITEINRNYLGSEITDVSQTILFERVPQLYEIGTYLHQLTRDYNKAKRTQQQDKQVQDLVNKFIYEFESCSNMHRRSDGYQFYFFYNIALHVAVQLSHFSKGYRKFNFLPKRLTANVLQKGELDSFYSLHGTLYLPEANGQKRNLLDFFYQSITSLVTIEKLEEVEQFCEWIYDRDFFWNFRDISTHNPKIRSGILFRTANLTFFQEDTRFEQLLKANNIKTIIDLRAEREINELPYSKQSLLDLNYVKAPFDPWDQPEWFQQEHHIGTNEEIAYRFFLLACKNQVKKSFEAILEEESGAVALHCFAGKDRTGIIVSMLHLLSGASIETVIVDYMASESDMKQSNLDIALGIISDSGGIELYLLSCGLSINQIQSLKTKLFN